jgi:hypothetical protein
VKWFAASITQEQRAGKGAIFGVVANALAAEQDLPDRLLLNAAFGQLLKVTRRRDRRRKALSV